LLDQGSAFCILKGNEIGDVFCKSFKI
jgi:hypothetical protein